MLKLKKISRKQELVVAKELNGNAVIASGALYTMKGDVRNDLLLVECKTTKNDYYSLTLNVWEKIAKEALQDGMRTPIMQVNLKNGDKRLAVFNAEEFEGTFSFNLDELTVYKKSFRITKEIIINIGRYKLVIIDWEIFLKVVYPAYYNEMMYLPF